MDFAQFPEALQKGHDFVGKASSMYGKSDGIKKTIDLYLDKLNALQAPKAEPNNEIKARVKRNAKAVKRKGFKARSRGKKVVKATSTETTKKAQSSKLKAES